MEDPTAPYVLMVDDDELFSGIIEQRFKIENVPFRRVATTHEALDLLQKEIKPELMLLDIQLYGADGLSFLSDIRDMPPLKDLPVIVLSNFNQQEEVARSKELGALRHVQKVSLEPAEVVAMVREALKGTAGN